MTGIIILAVLAVAIAAGLEFGDRRHAGPAPGLSGGWDTDDRDFARTKLDLIALGEQPDLRASSQHGTATQHARSW